MKIEFLLFNLVVIALPLAFSFEKSIHYVARWRLVFAAIGVVAPFFLTWELLTAGTIRLFNPDLVLALPGIGLPLGEFLMYVSTPFAALFIWELLRSQFTPQDTHESWRKMLLVLVPVLYVGAAAALVFGLDYTFIACIVFAQPFLFDLLLKIHLFEQKRAWYFVIVVLILIFVFDTYLTARPVVSLVSASHLHVRLPLVPLEDFLFGGGYLTSVLWVYEYLRTYNRRQQRKRELAEE